MFYLKLWGLLFLLFAFLLAQTDMEDEAKKKGWSSDGTLWVARSFALSVLVILIVALLESML